LFCLRRWRQHHPDLATLGAAASQTDVIAQLQALAPSGVSGLRWPARSAEAWRRCKLPVSLLAGHERCALSGASRWSSDDGVQSSGVAPSAGHSKAGSFTSLPHLRATPPEALPLPRVAMERLRGLAARLRGTSVARADQSATLTRPQALAHVRDTLERDDWGALEQLVLTWMQQRLEDPTDK